MPEALWPREVVLTGAAIPVRGQPFSFGVKRALCNNSYELPERTLLSKIIQPGMAVLEFGSSLGVVSAVAATRVGARGRVACVEASDDLASQSRAWLQDRHSNVRVFTGYGFPTSTLPSNLSVIGFNNYGVSLGGRVAYACEEQGQPAGMNADLPIFDIETLMAVSQIDAPDVLVCDIEGSELVMTAPSFSLPTCMRFLMIELHPHLYPKGALDTQRITAAIESLGFTLIERMGATYLYAR